MYPYPNLQLILDTSQYEFNPHALFLFAASALVLLLGLRVITSGQTKAHKFFLAICLEIIVWLSFTGMGYLVRDNEQLAAFWFRLDWVGVNYISVTVYAFAVEFIGLQRPRIVGIGYAIATVFLMTILTTNPMMRGVYKYSWGFFPLHDYLWSSAFFLFFFGYMGLAFGEYGLAYRRTNDPVKRNQLKYLFLAFFAAYLGSGDFFATYGVPIYPYGFVMIVIFLGVTAYTIAVHRLMDIGIVIRKTFIYSALSATLAAVYVAVIMFLTRLLEGYLGHISAYSSAIAAAVVVILSRPVHMRLQQWMDRRFPRESLDQVLLREATGGFAHEIKRPLANISMPVQLVLSQLERIHAAGQLEKSDFKDIQDKLNYVVRQTLEASDKIEAIRGLSLNLHAAKPVDVAELLVHVLDEESARMQKAKVIVNKAIEVAPSIVLGDSAQLRIALSNVVRNSIDALANSDVSVRCLNCTLRIVSQQIEVVIQDTGPGISPKDLGRLFDPWFSTKGSQGMGIGLFITRQIILGHGGDIGVSSNLKEGTVFRITLPLRKADIPHAS